MNINSCFLLTGTPALFVLAKTSKIKEEIPNATAVFIQFCIEIEPYLENDLLRPHLQNINGLSISETDPCLAVHFENIRIILEKNPGLLELYMTIIQDLKNIPPELFRVYQIANRYPQLLETHLQTIQSMGEFKPNTQLLEVYLRTVKKLKNNPNNALTKYTCGTFTSYQSLKENTPLQDIFFENTGNIWNLAPELVEIHLRSIGTLCNFKPEMLKTHLLINNLIYSDPLILEIHLNNMDTIGPQFLEDYIKTTFSLKDNQQLLKLYIYTICITKNTCNLEVHQKNTQNIRGFPLLLETYFKIILHLESNKSLLEKYIHGTHRINDRQNNQLLKVHFQNIYDFNEELLEPHFQNICNLSSSYLASYMQTLYSTEMTQDKACIIYRTHTITHISESQPDLLDLYFAACQLLENNQENISFYSYNAYFISQKHPGLLKIYFKTVLFLGNTFPNLLGLHLENIQGFLMKKI